MTFNEQNIIDEISKSLNIEFKTLLNNFIVHIGTLVCGEPRFNEMLVCVSLKYPYLDIMLPEDFVEEPNECISCVSEFRGDIGYNVSKVTDFIFNSFSRLLTEKI